jgi:tRNA G18 (ribose-2'-O)-methylase SpoU
MAKNIVIYGLHSVQAYLERHPEGILEVFLLKGRDDERMTKQVIKGLRPLGLNLQWRERGQLDELAGDSHHQGVVARVREQAPGDENDLVAYLDELRCTAFSYCCWMASLTRTIWVHACAVPMRPGCMQ